MAQHSSTTATPETDDGAGQAPAADLNGLLALLDLQDKVRLLTGATSWRLYALENIGLRSLAVSDGPAGVRGTGEKPGETSRSFPAPSALSATWDVELARRVGRLFAAEARRHGVDVVLAPQVNIQRTPVAGRHFECYSEDPLLTARIAGQVIAGMQASGVGACIKHFVANDSETARTAYVARLDERTLREVYLAPFEHAVREVGVWSVMAAYNQIDDGVQSAPATEHAHLLRQVLKTEWGFDGVVISDWLAARRTTESANGGLDLVMPGPGGPWESHLLAAVRSGAVPEAEIDDKVLRLLRLAQRVGALGAHRAEHAGLVTEDGLLREVAAAGTVVLRNTHGVLPVNPAMVRRLALIGPNAVEPFVQGGGSAHVTPDAVVTPEQGFRAALPAATVTVHRGGSSRQRPPALDVPARAADPVTGRPGVRVTLLDAAGSALSSTVTPTWQGWLRDLDEDVHAVRLETTVTLTEPGEHWLGLGTVGRWSMELDGCRVGGSDAPAGADVVLDSSVNDPAVVGAAVPVDGVAEVGLRATLQAIGAEGYGRFARGELHHRLPGPTAEEEISAAVAAAAAADLVVVVVGTNEEIESEGWDRPSLALPGRQDELVERVLDVAPEAVVVVNAGAPVLLPWLSRAGTVLWTWLAGQECGDAMADVVLGVSEPAGRLPWTLPAGAADVPVPHAVPGPDGVIAYGEGVHVGYRAWERDGVVPAAPFGHGLGWTQWRYQAARQVTADDDAITLEVDLTDVGSRAGSEVVQVYLEPPAGAGGERPVRWLAGFAVVRAEPGDTVTATVRLPRRAFEIWDVDAGAWTTPQGGYLARAGRSVADLRLSVPVVAPAAAAEPFPAERSS